MRNLIYYVATTTESPDADVTLIADDGASVVAGLKQQPGKAIWLCGGAELAAMLLRAGLIDGLILKLNPVVFGSGIPLFGRDADPQSLELTDSQVYQSGHAVLHYTLR